jgi:hypothetical protein
MEALQATIQGAAGNIVDMPIDRITVDQRLQMRNGLDEDWVGQMVQKLEEDGDIDQPIVVYRDGETFWLADGFHRVEAYRRAGRTEIEAEIIDGDFDAAVIHAEKANLNHGKNLSPDERRNIMYARIERNYQITLENGKSIHWWQLSNKAIAAELGVSYKSIQRWFDDYIDMAEGVTNVTPEDRMKVYGRDGTLYDMSGSIEANKRRAEEEARRQAEEKAAEERQLAEAFSRMNAIRKAKWLAFRVIQHAVANDDAILAADYVAATGSDGMTPVEFYAQAAEVEFPHDADFVDQFRRLSGSKFNPVTYVEDFTRLELEDWNRAEKESWDEGTIIQWVAEQSYFGDDEPPGGEVRARHDVPTHPAEQNKENAERPEKLVPTWEYMKGLSDQELLELIRTDRDEMLELFTDPDQAGHLAHIERADRQRFGRWTLDTPADQHDPNPTPHPDADDAPVVAGGKFVATEEYVNGLTPAVLAELEGKKVRELRELYANVQELLSLIAARRRRSGKPSGPGLRRPQQPAPARPASPPPPSGGYSRDRRWEVTRGFIQGQPRASLEKIRDDADHRASKFTNPDEAYCMAYAELERRNGGNYNLAYQHAQGLLNGTAADDTPADATDDTPYTQADAAARENGHGAVFQAVASKARELEMFHLGMLSHPQNDHLRKAFFPHLDQLEVMAAAAEVEAQRRDNDQSFFGQAAKAMRSGSYITLQEQEIQSVEGPLIAVASEYVYEDLLGINPDRLIALHDMRHDFVEWLRRMADRIEESNQRLTYIIETGEVPEDDEVIA